MAKISPASQPQVGAGQSQRIGFPAVSFGRQLMASFTDREGRFLRPRIVCLLFLSLHPALAYSAATDPLLLQQQAIQRIERYIDHFRRTADQRSLLPELYLADSELRASYQGLINRRNLAGAALSLIKLGDVQRMRNESHQALELYREGYKLAKQAKHLEYQAKALTGLARTELYGLKNFGDAAAHIEEALEVSAQLDEKDLLFDALDYLAQIQVSRGDLIAAADTLSRAFAVVNEIDDKTRLFYGYLDRAEVYQKLAEKCDYQRAFEPCYEALGLSKTDYERAFSIAQKLGYFGLAEQTKGFLRRLEARRALIQSQERFHDELLKQEIFHPKKPRDVLVQERFVAGSQAIPPGLIGLIQQAGAFSSTGDARSFYIQGLFHEMQGDNDAALVSYLKATDALEHDRGKLRGEKSRGSFLEDKIEFYYTPILHLLDRHRFVEAFDLFERSKSRAMADLLASKQLVLPSSEEGALLGESLNLNAQISRFQKDLFDLRSKPDRERYAAKIASTEKQLQVLERKHRKLLDRMAREAPRLKKLVVSEPTSLRQVQRSLTAERYEILQYLVLESQVVLWHLRGDALQARSVFLPRSELIKKVAALRKSLSDRQAIFDEQTASELFLFLIQPVLKEIKSDHLVIIPHEALNYIPFQVLRDPTDKSYLGERFAISYAPSTTVLLTLKRTGAIAGKTLLAVADPDIIDAADEVDAIARLYAGKDKIVKDILVREADVKAWAGSYDLLHLSVHGRFRPEEPLLSYLKLRKDGRDDGELTAAEMFGLPLANTHLAVLSACETGQAEATHANEILGMVRALLYAGAKSLIVSSWAVDSASTALYMQTFYREAQARPLSTAARAALVTVKAHPQYQHPYYWGPFLMIGK